MNSNQPIIAGSSKVIVRIDALATYRKFNTRRVNHPLKAVRYYYRQKSHEWRCNPVARLIFY